MNHTDPAPSAGRRAATRPHPPRRTRCIAVAAISAIVAASLAACSSGSYAKVPPLAPSTPAGAAPSSAAPTIPSLIAPGVTPPADDPFYQTPAGFVSAKPGAVLRSRPVTLSATYMEAWPASRAFQLLYRTTAVDGSATTTVATVLLPSHPAAGPRRLVSDQIAEDSLTTNCAPSYLLRQNLPTASIPDKQLIGAALAHGYDVVVPDYEGPQSELLIGPLEGRETLDGIRAAENYAPDGLDGSSAKVALEGYSGGSVPTVWAAALAASYAPGLHIAGAAAGGVAADLAGILAHADHSSLFGGVMLALVSLARAYPQLKLSEILNARGAQVAAVTRRDGDGCGGGVFGLADGTTSEYTKFATGQSLSDFPPLKAVLGTLDAATAAPAPRAPAFLYNTVHDQIVNIAVVDALYRSYCQRGTAVTYERSSTGDHISGISTFALMAPIYIAARFAGQAAPSTCSSHPVDPKE